MNLKFKEIEYKYWANGITLDGFIERLERVCPDDETIHEPLYVVSCDDYYIPLTRFAPGLPVTIESPQNFIRFRKGTGDTPGLHRYELTLKEKEEGNVVRKEINLDVSNNNQNTICEFIKFIGYKKIFQVYKEAWIWQFNDCVISYYTLSDGKSVIELEAINYKHKQIGLDIIDKWESNLKLSEHDKESNSLFEIYSKMLKLEPTI